MTTMRLPRDLKHAHCDGYRVRGIEQADRLAIYGCLVHAGKVIRRFRFWEVRAEPEALLAHYPEWHRRKKLLAAVLRCFNEAGDLEEVKRACAAAKFAATAYGAEMKLQIVAVESEETHVRTFLMEGGNYLRLIEDETAELISPTEMRDIIEDESQAGESDAYT